MITNYPDVSVLMAVKNESKHLKDAVLSIESQDCTIIEIILVDDNSTDNTMEIAFDLQRHNLNLFVYTNPGSGKVDAYNYAFSRSKAPYVCFFAGDDIMPQGSIMQRLSPLTSFNKTNLVVSLSKIRILSADESLNGKLIPRAKGKASLSGQSPLFSRSLANIVFPIPSHLPNEDNWTAAILTYYPIDSIISMDTLCCDWRLHEGNSYNRDSSCIEYRKHLIPRYHAYKELYKKYGHVLSSKNSIQLRNHVRAIELYKKQSILPFLFVPLPISYKVTLLRTFNTFFFLVFKLLDKIR